MFKLVNKNCTAATNWIAVSESDGAVTFVWSNYIQARRISETRVIVQTFINIWNIFLLLSIIKIVIKFMNCHEWDDFFFKKKR